MLEESQPLVSIITPTYNHGNFIRQCIESVLAQNYLNWEQIIIDDGSTDNTAAIIAEYSDPRIRYIRQLNRGPFELAKTYNNALSESRGEIIAILEGDDFWPPEKLQALVPAFHDPQVVLAYGEASDVGINGQEQRRTSHTSRLRKNLPQAVLCNDPLGSATHYMLTAEGRSLVSPSTVLIRRGALDRIGKFQYVPDLPLTDYPTFIELSLVGKFNYLPQVMGYRRRHEKSITVNYAKEIHDKVSEFTLRFLEKYQCAIDISTLKRQHIEANWREAEDKIYFSDGRLQLLHGRWSVARKCFRRSACSRNFLVCLASLVGLLFSWIHINIEGIMKLGGRAELS